MSGSKLTERIRSKAFSCLLRQEISYFDLSQNSCGAICNRLSLDALAIQQITGIRLGIIFETFSMCLIGLILGCLLSWQLSLIATLFILIVFVVSLTDVQLETRIAKRTSVILEQASAVNILRCTFWTKEVEK